MPYNFNGNLWPDNNEYFFRDAKLIPIRQEGPHCVSTSLAILTGAEPNHFQGIINTQNPISWSDKLKEWGMKLAYCPTDARKLRFYISEWIELDDLFTLSYYTAPDQNAILGDPDKNGWVCSSHVVVMHRDKIFDPARGTVVHANNHTCNDCHTKRVFRVVSASYERGL
ncbi:MAG: hypothetical protein K8L99_31545 [Anaerolineae bacterium]|nr:hypothetical protein [Anaerolineae bacterium]